MAPRRRTNVEDVSQLVTDLRSGPQELRERAAKLLTASVARIHFCLQLRSFPRLQGFRVI